MKRKPKAERFYTEQLPPPWIRVRPRGPVPEVALAAEGGPFPEAGRLQKPRQSPYSQDALRVRPGVNPEKALRALLTELSPDFVSEDTPARSREIYRAHFASREKDASNDPETMIQWCGNWREASTFVGWAAERVVFYGEPLDRDRPRRGEFFAAHFLVNGDPVSATHASDKMRKAEDAPTTGPKKARWRRLNDILEAWSKTYLPLT